MPPLYSRFSDLLLLSAPIMGAEAHFRLSLLALFPFDVNEPKQVPYFTQGHRPFTAAIFPNRFAYPKDE
jgi:hypothetical protein